jgi:hypothetical protein
VGVMKRHTHEIVWAREEISVYGQCFCPDRCGGIVAHLYGSLSSRMISITGGGSSGFRSIPLQWISVLTVPKSHILKIHTFISL